MDSTITIFTVLLSLAESGTYNCDTDGARKIAIVIEAATKELALLKEPRDLDSADVAGPEEGEDIDE